MAQLTYTIQHLAHSTGTHHFSSIFILQTKVCKPDQFDSADPCKLWTFLVQCKLNFSNRPRAFQMDHAKVTFTQSYLKGIALEWFEPDLLTSTTSVSHPLWMDNYAEFMLELQANFSPHDPVGDTEYKLQDLSMKNGQQINKYVVESLLGMSGPRLWRRCSSEHFLQWPPRPNQG